MDRQTVASKLRCALPRVLLATMVMSFAGAGLYFALRSLDWRNFPLQLRQLDWRWVALAVAFDILSYVAQGLRWSLLLDGRSLWRTTRAIYAGLFVNEVIPLRPGEAIRAWIAARDFRIGTLAVVPSMLAERLMDGLWLVVALLVALFLAPLPPALIQAIKMLALILSLALAAAFVFGRTRIEFLRKVTTGMRDRRALAVSAVFLAAQGLAFWSVARASHLSLGVFAAFVVMVVVRVGTLLPGAPANLGTHQFSTVLGLSMFGVPQAQAAAYSLVVFSVLTLPLLLIGLIACLSAGLTWRTLHQIRQAAVLPDPTLSQTLTPSSSTP